MAEIPRDKLKDKFSSSHSFRLWNEAMAKKFNPDRYHTQSFFIIRLFEKMRTNAVIKFLKPEANDRILEVGCGAGNIIKEIREGRIVGIDLSLFLLQTAKTKKYNTEVSFLQGYAENMPFDKNTFDKIYCSEVLEHVCDPTAVCREVHRIIKDGGLFIVSVPNEWLLNKIKALLYFLKLDKVINRVSGYKFSRNMMDEWHLHNFDIRAIKKIMGADFTFEYTRFIPSSIMPLRIIVVGRKNESITS